MAARQSRNFFIVVFTFQHSHLLHIQLKSDNMVFGACFGETKKYLYNFHSSGGQHRATRNKIAHHIRSVDEMDWEQSQTSQAIQHLYFNLSTKWDHAFNMFANTQNVEIQRCLQAGPSNLEHICRKIFEDYAIDGRIIIQSPHSPEAATNPLSIGSSKQQAAAESDQHAEIQKLTLKLQRAEEELTAVRSQLEKAEIRTNQLRKLIVPTGTEPILDSKIQHLFSEVRTLTQKVVSKLYTKTPRYWESSVDESRVFFKGIKDFPLNLQQDAIHGELFDCLRQWFFSNAIKDRGLGEKYEKLQTLLVQTEEELVEAVQAKNPGGKFLFEVRTKNRYLTVSYPELHGEEIREWRNATLKYINLLQDTSNDPAFFADHLEGFFKPAETDDPKAQQRGRKNLETLCNKSFELGALMRRAEDHFEIFTVNKGTSLTDCEDIAERWRSYSDKDSCGVEIVDWCFFGGLRKISKEYPTKPVVLEKAHVSGRFVRRTE